MPVEFQMSFDNVLRTEEGVLISSSEAFYQINHQLIIARYVYCNFVSKETNKQNKNVA